MSSAWGDPVTRFFFELTPERVLEAVESAGLQCTGRCSAMGSFENRVYDVELEAPEGARQNSLEFRRVIKFYRPGRWSREQIQEEHDFLLELEAAEIPVVAPLRFADASTLRQDPRSGIFYALFPKFGGRAPDELNDDQCLRIGRLLARVHTVGAARAAPHRIRIGPETYGLANLEFLLERGFLPETLRGRYAETVRAICAAAQPRFDSARVQRIHGDCHFGNLLWRPEGPAFLDFDDMVQGPPVQDVWLLIPGRDEEALRQRELLLEGYEELREFDRASLRLIEPLRALRFVHYAAWIARRWEDPAFPAAFPQFGGERYWQEQLRDLEEQLALG